MFGNPCIHYSSYVQYSGVAAKAVRACIKGKEAQEAAAKRGKQKQLVYLLYKQTVYFILYTVHCTLYTVILHTVYWIPYTV